MIPAEPQNILADYKSFEQMLFQAFRVQDRGSLPFEKVEYVFDIFQNSQNFSFDDADERLSNLLLFSACFYAAKKDEEVCFLSPTYFYAQQALVKSKRFLSFLGGSEKTRVTVTVPGLYGYKQSIQKTNIVFMHGKDFSEYLPKEWSGRKIIQIFPGIDVPVDPIRYSSCSDPCD